MANRARKWLAVSILFAASVLAVWGLDAPQQERVAEAAAPSGMRFSLPINPQEQGNHVRRESIPPSQSGPAPLAGPASLFQPLLTPIFGENYRANTDTQSPNLAQQEPSIAINPTNLLNVVVAAKDERAGSNSKQVWIYTSTDGGVTWLNQIFPLTPPSPYSSDPVVNFSDDGICYVTSLPYGGGAADGIQVARSTNGGITFSPGVHLPGTNSSTDKEWTWVDNFPSSPYYHRIYTAYMDFGSGSVWRLNYSSDRGVTWSQPSAPVSAYQFPMPVVLPNGHVLVTYLMAADALAYARSTNGGVSFSGPQLVRGIIRPYCPPDNPGCSIWRLNPIPATGVSPTNGSIVVVWADGNGGRSTTYYTRSTDNGATWSSTAPLAVSPIPNTYQVEPWVEADDRGTFHAIWYDDRENPNTSIFHIYYSQSTDNGATWSNAVRISTATSDLRIGIPSSYNRAAGDYIQVAGWGGNVYAAWTDTRSGTGEDIYVVRGVQPLTTTVTPMPTAPGTFVPTSTITRTAVPTSTACGTDANYVFTTATATIVPGTVDTGNHCDECFTQITLPFPVRLYDQTFTQAALDSNGKAHFPAGVSGFPAACFPIPNATYVIVPYLEDLRTDTACTGGPCGIYTSISGTAPNRIFNIEWRTTYFTGGGSANFEIRLYEDQSQGFDVIYGLISRASSGAFAGVQRDQTRFTQYACGQGGDVSNGRLVMYDLPLCPTGTPPTSTRTPTPTNAPTNTPTPSTTCSPAWSQVPSPNVEPRGNRLEDIAAISPSDIWAVGGHSTSSNPDQTLVLHWNGTEWGVVPSPNPGTYNHLYGVVAFSSSDAWAVGSYYAGSAGYQTMVLHWNGTEWSVVSSPSPGTNNNFLRAVAGTGPNDIWAVGYYRDRFSSIDRTLVLHWNGTEWSVVPSPSPGIDTSYLEDVAAASASDAWAVGYTLGSGRTQTLILHWNGTQWNTMTSPNPGVDANSLEGVAVVSTTDVWAVGQSYSVSSSQSRSMALHWNGTKWTVVPSPNPGSSGNFLTSVVAIAASDIWAVGMHSSGTYFRTFTTHWNGSVWNVEPSPNFGISDNVLYGVAAVGTDVWAVGYYEPGGYRRTLVERYAVSCGTPTSVPTSTATIRPTNTQTNVPTSTRTSTPIIATNTAIPPTTPTVQCTANFTDVPNTNTFYPSVRCLACKGIISGYADGTFRPDNLVTRGQLAKIVSNAGNFTESPGAQIFQDVAPDHTFYEWINRLTNRGYMTGYTCGGPGEPCVNNRPYFRPFANATRGQTAKIVANAAMIETNIPPTQQTFEDVPPTQTFWLWIERLAARGVMGGYQCGGPGEPCVLPARRAYFRPNNDVTRGQSAKIVANTFFPTCAP